MLKNTFLHIIGKPHSSFSTQSMPGEKQEWSMPFLFGNKRKSANVLPCGFHLAGKREQQPNPHRECDLQTCQKKDPNWRVFKGCGHSFHVDCVPSTTCPICQDGIRRKVKEHAQKAKEAIFTSSKLQKPPTDNTGPNAEDQTENEMVNSSLTDGEIEKQAHQLNSEILSWPKYSPSSSSQSSPDQTLPSSSDVPTTHNPQSKWEKVPQYGRRFNFKAEKAMEEFAEKCFGDKPTDQQIQHLLATDGRLSGETFERVKRKILALIKRKKNASKVSQALQLPVPPWGG